jgi:cobalt-zinc-cadmium efflux system protein
MLKCNLLITLFLNIGIVVSQIIGFLFTQSVALLGDAFHNLSDVISIVVSLIFHKSDSRVAKWINVGLLVILIGWMGFEAVDRFINPQEVHSLWVMILAGISIVFNFISVKLLHNHTHDKEHVRATYIHLLSDVLTSVAVLVGAIIMFFTGWFIIDAIILCIIIIYITYMTVGLIMNKGH